MDRLLPPASTQARQRRKTRKRTSTGNSPIACLYRLQKSPTSCARTSASAPVRPDFVERRQRGQPFLSGRANDRPCRPARRAPRGRSRDCRSRRERSSRRRSRSRPGARHILGLHDPPVTVTGTRTKSRARAAQGQSASPSWRCMAVRQCRVIPAAPASSNRRTNSGTGGSPSPQPIRVLTVTGRSQMVTGAGHGAHHLLHGADRGASLPRPHAGRSSVPSSRNLCQEKRSGGGGHTGGLHQFLRDLSRRSGSPPGYRPGQG